MTEITGDTGVAVRALYELAQCDVVSGLLVCVVMAIIFGVIHDRD